MFYIAGRTIKLPKKKKIGDTPFIRHTSWCAGVFKYPYGFYFIFYFLLLFLGVCLHMRARVQLCK